MKIRVGERHVAFVEKKDYGYADSESPAENEGGVGAARSQADRLLAEALRREGQSETTLQQSELANGDHVDRISTRFPSTARAGEDPIAGRLSIGLAAMKMGAPNRSSN